jgi:S1-C subfamily serine protease
LWCALIRVTLADQSTYDAKVVGFDQDKDVAVLRVDAPKDKLRPIPVGVSADLLVGQKVFAIGNPVSEFNYIPSPRIWVAYSIEL